jgi:pre-mRNA-splicing factor SYF1
MQDGNVNGQAIDQGENVNAMKALERQIKAPQGFVAASTGPEGGNRTNAQPAVPPPVNPDAIDIDEDL